MLFWINIDKLISLRMRPVNSIRFYGMNLRTLKRDGVGTAWVGRRLYELRSHSFSNLGTDEFVSYEEATR